MEVWINQHNLFHIGGSRQNGRASFEGTTEPGLRARSLLVSQSSICEISSRRTYKMATLRFDPFANLARRTFEMLPLV